MGWVCICRRRSWRVSPLPGNPARPSPAGLRRYSRPGEAAAPPERSPHPARRLQPSAAAPIPAPPPRPIPLPLPLPPRTLPPGASGGGGSSAVTRTTRPGEGQILLPAQPEIPRSHRSQRPPPRHCGSRRPRHQPPHPHPGGGGGQERDGNLLGVGGIPIYGV